MRAGLGRGSSPPLAAPRVPELGEAGGGSHILQEEASEQWRGAQQEGEGAGEDHNTRQTGAESCCLLWEGAQGRAADAATGPGPRPGGGFKGLVSGFIGFSG